MQLMSNPSNNEERNLNIMNRNFERVQTFDSFRCFWTIRKREVILFPT